MTVPDTFLTSIVAPDSAVEPLAYVTLPEIVPLVGAAPIVNTTVIVLCCVAGVAVIVTEAEAGVATSPAGSDNTVTVYVPAGRPCMLAEPFTLEAVVSAFVPVLCACAVAAPVYALPSGL